MLEKLATINWSSLTHAYGNASDVPDQLRALASNRRRDRQVALQTLHSTIWHQGTVYQATSVAVPFLFEILRAPEGRGKTGILRLIQAISSARRCAKSETDPLWREEKPYAFEAAHQLENMKWAQQGSEAVSAEVETLLILLTNAFPVVRGTAALTLAYCAIRFPEVEPTLRRQIDEERHPVVKASLIYVWAKMWKETKHNPAAIKQELRSLARNRHERPVVRLISALGLVQFLKEGRYPNLTRFLAIALRKSGKAVAAQSLFDLSSIMQESLADRHEMRLDLCQALARTPICSLKEQIILDLEMLCRERRSNFPKVIPVFGNLLSDDDPDFRVKVAMRLSQMGTWVRFARKSLVRALDDSESDVALWSAVALSKLRDERVLPFLVTKLEPEKHSDLTVDRITETTPITERLGVQQAVNKHLKSLRLLLDALRPYGRAASQAVPHLLALLNARGPNIQKMVCAALACVGEPETTVPAIVKLLGNPETQCEAASSLMTLGPAAKNAIPDLIRFLQDFPQADNWAKQSAIKALGFMGVAASSALSLLEKNLQDPDVGTKCEAALAIWRIAPQTPNVLEVLINELKERTKPGWATHGCAQVVRTLEAIGSPAKLAEPLLQKLLADPDPWSRVHAARALWKFGASLSVYLPVLIDDLLSRPVGIMTGLLSAECLAEIGPPAAAAIPRLKEILAREESLAHRGTDWVESDEAFQNGLSYALRRINGEASSMDS